MHFDSYKILIKFLVLRFFKIKNFSLRQYIIKLFIEILASPNTN